MIVVKKENDIKVIQKMLSSGKFGGRDTIVIILS